MARWVGESSSECILSVAHVPLDFAIYSSLLCHLLPTLSFDLPPQQRRRIEAASKTMLRTNGRSSSTIQWTIIFDDTASHTGSCVEFASHKDDRSKMNGRVEVRIRMLVLYDVYTGRKSRAEIHRLTSMPMSMLRRGLRF